MPGTAWQGLCCLLRGPPPVPRRHGTAPPLLLEGDWAAMAPPWSSPKPRRRRGKPTQTAETPPRQPKSAH
eukprot:8861800-Pyramimonas_sp.AAC.1